MGWMFGIIFVMLFAGIPLAISYLAYRSAYRSLVEVLAKFAAVFVWCALLSIPRRLGRR